jgi:pilus assembly protein Flp/PilA
MINVFDSVGCDSGHGGECRDGTPIPPMGYRGYHGMTISTLSELCKTSASKANRIAIPLEENPMNTMLLKLYVKFQELASREEGQDLVEYALVVALIAFGATAGMKALAGGLNTAFGQISTTLGSYVS